MKSIANTIVSHVLDKCKKSDGLTLRFVLPSYPADLLLEIGSKIEERVLGIADRNVQFRYGIAYALGQKWLCGTQLEKEVFSEVQKRNWYNETDNMTSLRHLTKGPDEDSLIVLLAGYDDIRDQSSLEDFLHLNQDYIWRICLKRSFKKWVEDAIKNYVNPDGNEHGIESTAALFTGLYQTGLTDPLEISYYLDKKDFSTAMDGRDAFKDVLVDLEYFGLPNMIGFEKCSKDNFTKYASRARKFFTYNQFLDASARKRIMASVEKYEDNNDDELAAETLGSFSNRNDLINSLKKYINTASPVERDRLAKADFIYINNSILGYKGPNPPPKDRDTEKKLTGHALEVFLEALWRTLSNYKKNNRGLIARKDIKEIVFSSLEFKHHLGSDADTDAWHFLRRLIGGIDQYLESQILIGTKEQVAHVQSKLALKDEKPKFIPAGRTEPQLIFEVAITGKSGRVAKEKFAWLLGENSLARFLVGIYDWVFKQYSAKKGKNIWLPAFAIEYMNEMFMAKDIEDIIRILNQGMKQESRKSLIMCDLIVIPGPDQDDCLIKEVSNLSMCYQLFLEAYYKKGFFTALASKSFNDMRRAYQKLLENYLDKSAESTLGTKLMKAFLLLPQKYMEEEHWKNRKDLDCGVVTPLHPALLQMIQHQHTYLCKSFNSLANEGLEEVGNKGLSLKHWHKLLDLSQIKWPIVGVLDGHGNLNTNIHSYDHIHLVGMPEGKYSTVSSKLLVKYEEDEGDDIKDADLFRESQEAKLIKQILLDYCKLHPYANDGISVGVYCGGSIQHLIAGLNAFLAETVDKMEGNTYSLNLVIFSDSPNDAGLLKWIDAWEERWQLAKEKSNKGYYVDSAISVYYHVIPQNNLDQLRQQILQMDLDVQLFTNFTKTKRNDFFPISDARLFLSVDDYIRFPILEKVGCVVKGDGTATERKLVVSNRQFQLGALHAEIMARLRNPSYTLADRHVVVSTSEFQPWLKVLNAAHEKNVWVVCIDPIVDEKLIRSGGKEREIIGFGTGVGAHGEFNFTVSTEQFYLSDIIEKMETQLAPLIGEYDKDICTKLVRNLIKETSSMPGLSVVKATSQDSEYIRDFIAYAFTRKLLPREDAFCDEIISLDAFLHWFDFNPQDMRPDLLRLQAHIVDGLFKIKAQIIECKFAQESERHLEKALRQVEIGLQHLVSKFRPRQSNIPLGVESDDKKTPLPPDQRYWWLQLHRLIASRGEIVKKSEKETIQALEFLSDGYYSIEWEAAGIGFWTDAMHGNVIKNTQGNFTIDDQEMNIYSFQCGRDFIREVGLDKRVYELFDGKSTLKFKPIEPGKVQLIGSDIKQKPVKWMLPSEQSSGESMEKKMDNAGPKLPAQRSIPERILLGSGRAGGRDVYWEFGHSELPNRHLLIFGASGTGKTYTIQAVMAELSKYGINSLIVDYSTGFTNKQLETVIVEKLAPKQHIVRNEPIPINPFRKQCDYVDDVPLYDTPANVAQRVSGVFSEVFTLGEQQKAVLYGAIQSGINNYGERFNLRMLLDRIMEIKEEGGASALPATTIANKMRLFVDMNPFGTEEPESWERLFLDPVSNCHILQLAGFMKNPSRLITEFSLIDLYWYYKTKGTKDNPRVIILDEIQNLDHRLESPLGQFLTEGRKYGICLILATQTISNFAKDEKSRLFQASHKLFFKPSDTEIKTFAQLLADATGESQDVWVQRLSVLKRGECYSIGPAYNPASDKLEVSKAFKIKIKALEERFD